jgi:transposase-like protein/IS1 family transposase
VTCHNCQTTCNRFGKHRNGLQRYRCGQCRKTFTEDHVRPLGDMRLPFDKATAILQLMLEGMSIRAIERFTGVHRDTIMVLLGTASAKAKQVLDTKVQNIKPKYVQMDELWSFVHTKEHNLGWDDPGEWGSAYIWLALDSETKLIITHHIGGRNSVSAFNTAFDLRNRTAGRYQITSDSLKAYVGAIKQWYGRDVDFAQLHKIYGKISSSDWYGSGRVIGAVPHVKIGRPDFRRISTSHVERANLTVRMHLRRLTRLTNAFSKSLDNHKAAITLYVAFYNFCRPHQTHKGATPAMAAGITDHIWTLRELIAN